MKVILEYTEDPIAPPTSFETGLVYLRPGPAHAVMTSEPCQGVFRGTTNEWGLLEPG